MKRRGFLGRLAAIVAAPVAVAKLPPAATVPAAPAALPDYPRGILGLIDDGTQIFTMAPHVHFRITDLTDDVLTDI